MLRTLQVEEIARLLLLLPDLVEQQQRGSTTFASNATEWLKSLEQLLLANRLHQAGTIAMLRADLVLAEHGDARGAQPVGSRPSRFRLVSAAAVEALRRASDIASALITENQPRLAEADRVAQQIAAIAVSRGLVPARPTTTSNTQYLHMTRWTLASSDLENALTVLDGLVGPHDALIFLDRALAPYTDIIASRGVSVTERALPTANGS